MSKPVKLMGDSTITSTVPRKSIEAIVTDPMCIKVSRVLLHQATHVPGGGTETTLSETRTPGLTLDYHPIYGVVIQNKGQKALIPLANVVIAYE